MMNDHVNGQFIAQRSFISLSRNYISTKKKKLLHEIFKFQTFFSFFCLNQNHMHSNGLVASALFCASF